MDKEEQIKIIIKELVASMPKYTPTPRKPWKELSGLEWTQRCLDADWENERPRDDGSWK